MNLLLGIILILFLHYIADFAFQSNKMAAQKAYNEKILLYHVLVYSLVFGVLFCLYGYIIDALFGLSISIKHWIQMGIGITIINGIAHYIIDYFTSKISTGFYLKGQTRNMFLTIGMDQYLHTSLLIASYLEMLVQFNYI